MANDAVFHKYRYRAKPLVMLLCIAFFAACTYGLVHKATTNDRGLIINHLIELDASQATIFHWVLAACGVGVVILGIVGLVSAYTRTVFLEITENGITVPAALRRKTVHIPFAEITAIHLQEVQRQTFLTIKHANKKTYVSRGNMPSKADFEEVVALVGSKVSTVL